MFLYENISPKMLQQSAWLHHQSIAAHSTIPKQTALLTLPSFYFSRTNNQPTNNQPQLPLSQQLVLYRLLPHCTLLTLSQEIPRHQGQKKSQANTLSVNLQSRKLLPPLPLSTKSCTPAGHSLYNSQKSSFCAPLQSSSPTSETNVPAAGLTGAAHALRKAHSPNQPS